MRTNPVYSGPPSDHFDGTRFFNPGPPSTDRTPGEIWRWRSARAAALWPTRVEVQAALPEQRVAGLRITMVGHASALIQTAGLNILTDPIWSERASPVGFAGPRRVTAPGVAFERLPPIDLVLVSHNHYDHLDLTTLKRLHQVHRPVVLVPLGNDSLLRSAIPGVRVVAGDWESRHQVGPLQVTLTCAQHWSSRSLLDRRMALWCGFWIESESGSVWFAGDTGYGDGAIFRDLGARLGAPDVALLPIGAYAPRWFMAPQHIDPAQAVQILLDTGARQALGIHWGTFQLTDESREAPAEELRTALTAAGIAFERFPAIQPGEVFNSV